MMNGGPVSWLSRLQKTTALSVTEAEYMTMSEALKECLWLHPFLKSIGMDNDDAPVLKVDNQSAIALAKNPEFHKHTKHVGIRYHWIRQEQEIGNVRVCYVPTNQNGADMFTKAVSRSLLESHIENIGLC